MMPRSAGTQGREDPQRKGLLDYSSVRQPVQEVTVREGTASAKGGRPRGHIPGITCSAWAHQESEGAGQKQVEELDGLSK